VKTAGEQRSLRLGVLRCFGFGLALAAICGSASLSPGQIIEDIPEEMDDVAIVEHLDEQVPLGLEFVDERGNAVTLDEYFGDGKPVLLTLNYYGCPMLCGLQLNGLVDAMKEIDWTPGDEFEMVTVSINPSETHTLAKLKQQNYIKEYGRREAESGWHFLTGRQASITGIAEATGFAYEYVEDTGEYAHAAVAYVLTPDGRLSRYLYGVLFDPQTVKLSLMEAAGGEIGSPLDQILLYCFHYDAAKGRYAPVAMNIMRIGAGLAAVVVGGLVATFWFRDHRRNRMSTLGGAV